MRDLLLDVDQQARTRARGLEGNGRLPKGFCDKHYALLPHEERELKRLKHAMAAAPDADTFVALARGRTVDESRLNPTMITHLKRHGAS